MLTTILLSLVIAAVLWLAGLALARVPPLPRVRRRVPLDDVTVIIPARDEAARLPALLRSLAAEPPGEVIVADDGSTDGTALVARSLGARVITVPPAPAGWRGKPWASWVAAHHATGRTLVFLDADLWLEPGGLARLVAAHREHGGLVSAEPHHVVRRPFEQLSLAFNIVRVAGVSARGAFGPCVVTSRVDYLAVGGHAHPTVHGQVLENLALGRVFAASGRAVRAFRGRGAVSFRMYPDGLGELVEGWAKGFASGAAASAGGTVALSVAWISGGLMAAGALPLALAAGSAGLALTSALLYLAYAAQVAWLSRRVGNFSWLGALLYPVALAAFVWIFAYSLYLVRWRRRVTWKGRSFAVGGSRGA